MVFNEITPEAIKFAAGHTRELDTDLVDAQETRRIIDRLYGYEVSPVLWRKIRPLLSAGACSRWQLRLLVQRERERIAFTAAEYWGLDAELLPGPFGASLSAIDGVRVATGKDFDRDGALRGADVVRPTPMRRTGWPTRSQGSPCGWRMGREAVQALSLGTVHHVHAAAGGLPEAAVGRPAHHARGAGALRARLHHLYAHRLGDAVGHGYRGSAQAGGRAVRRGPCGVRSAALQGQGQERAGGARGHPPRRRPLPHADGPGRGAPRRRLRALRPDLEAHGRLADGRCAGGHHHRSHLGGRR